MRIDMIGQHVQRDCDALPSRRIILLMNPLEFTAELTPEPVLPIPQEIAAQLPKSGRARVILLPILPSADNGEDAQWRAGAYEQFLRDDSPEDSVYDNY